MSPRVYSELPDSDVLLVVICSCIRYVLPFHTFIHGPYVQVGNSTQQQGPTSTSADASDGFNFEAYINQENAAEKGGLFG